MKAELLQGFYLGDLLVEPLKGRVSGRAGSRHLPPKAVEVLLCLAQTPGELVTREFLLSDAWGAGQGSHESLSHAVSEIRHALHDHPDNPVYVQTLPKRGYRLLVEPEVAVQPLSSIVMGTNNGVRATDIGLLENLRRRGVLETALAYLLVGWLLIQIADIVFAQLLLPAWAATFVTILVIAGFPIAIVLSWFLEFRDGRAIVHQVSAADARKRRFSRTYVSVIGALATASALVFVYDRYFGLPEADIEAGTAAVAAVAPSLISENTIAVLPFVNVDGSDETQTFANGIVDDVITRLARVPGLRVSSRGDSHTLPPNSAHALVRQRLRVAMYLEGSVQIAANKIRVTLQLINSADGFHILARTFDRPRQDFFDIRDEITALTVSSLRPTLPSDTQSMSAIPGEQTDLDAYMLYRRGVDESRKPQTPATIAGALRWFDAALGVDPDYAAAFAGKCNIYATGYRENNDPEFMRNAETACGTAIELSPNLDIVHTALGDLYRLTGKLSEARIAYLEALRINPDSVTSLTGLSDVYRLLQQPDDAEASLRQAIGLQPGNWLPYNFLGYFLFRQGRYVEAAQQFANVVSLDNTNIRGHANQATALMLAGDFAAAAPAYQKAIHLEPRPDSYSNLGLMHYYLGQPNAALSALRSAIDLAPNNHLTWSNLGDVLWNDGQYAEARNAFRTAQKLATGALEINPNDPAVLMDFAWIKAMLNEQQVALETIERAVALSPDDPYAYYIEGLIHFRAGEIDAALAALQQAAGRGYSVVIMSAEPHLTGLHSDPRFDAIVKNARED